MFVADYVLMEYGTGAIMAVPAHDQRDFEFAEAFDLEIRRVVEPRRRRGSGGRGLRRAHRENERLVNSGEFDGLPAPEAIAKITAWLEERGPRQAGGQLPAPRLAVSRQRYWGCPIPVVYCDERRDRPGARGPAPGRAARRRGLRAEGTEPARGGRGLGRDRVPALRRPGAARDRHDGHLRRLLLVLPALPRPAQRRARPGTARSPTTGCRSTSTSAASSTRSCT